MNVINEEYFTAKQLAIELNLDTQSIRKRGDALFRDYKIRNVMHKVVDGQLQRVFTEKQAELIRNYPERRGRPKKS